MQSDPGVHMAGVEAPAWTYNKSFPPPPPPPPRTPTIEDYVRDLPSSGEPTRAVREAARREGLIPLRDRIAADRPQALAFDPPNRVRRGDRRVAATGPQHAPRAFAIAPPSESLRIGTIKLADVSGPPLPPGVLAIDLDERPGATLALQFERTGTVVAALPHHRAIVYVDNGAVIHVAYHSTVSTLRPPNQRESELVASAAAAMRLGAFRFDGPRQVRQEAASLWWSRLRSMPPEADLSLSLYVMYACSDAVLPREVLRAASDLRARTSVDLFDAHLLVGPQGRQQLRGLPVFPCCPMLAQGWSLLQSKDAPVDETVLRAERGLVAGTWTTLTLESLQPIRRSVEEGRLA